MRFAKFQSFCPYEIDDEILNINGSVERIYDIQVIHSLRNGITEFKFEFEDGGAWFSADYIKKRV